MRDAWGDRRPEAEKQAEAAWVRAEADVRQEQDALHCEYLRTGEIAYVWPELLAEARRRKIAWLEAVRVAKAGER